MKKVTFYVFLVYQLLSIPVLWAQDETRVSGTLKMHPWVDLPIVVSTDIQGGLHSLGTLNLGATPATVIGTSIPNYERTNGMVVSAVDADSNNKIRYFEYDGTTWLEIYVVSAWEPSTTYAIGDYVVYDDNFYVANSSFTSSATFSADIASWNNAGGKDGKYTIAEFSMDNQTLSKVAASSGTVPDADKDITLATAGYVLANSSTGATTLDNLSNVNTTSVSKADNDILQWDGGNSEWVNKSIVDAGLDRAEDNEGKLTVAEGDASSSLIESNTTGSIPVTIKVAGINTISETTASNTITITATEVDGDPLNEVQLLSAGGTDSPTINLSDVSGNGGGTITFVAEGDVTLGRTGNSITISSSAGITAETDPVVKTIDGIVKSDGSTISKAVAGTDYSIGTSTLSTGLIKSTTGTGDLSIAIAGTDYAIPSGTVANFSGSLSGDVSGTQSSTQVDGIKGVALPALSSGFLKYDGSAWSFSGSIDNATTTTNLAGGAKGSLPYQTAPGATEMLAAGSDGLVLKMDGTTGLPEWGTIDVGAIPSSIDASKIGDGSVSNTEYQYLDGLTDNIQDQLDGKLSKKTIVSGTNTKISYDTNGLITGGSSAILASSDFVNQGTVTTLLHGNTSGNPSWGQVVNSDIANGTIDLTTKVTGVLSPVNGGTGVNNGTYKITLGGNLTTGGAFTTSGSFPLTLTTTGTTNITLPTSGTLVTADQVSAAETDPVVKAINGIVKSDGSTISAAIAGTDYAIPSGTVAKATVLETARTIGMTGDVSWTSAAFDGSQNVSGTSTINTDAVDGTNINLTGNTAGDLMYYNGTDWARVPAGTSGQILRSNGASAPSWTEGLVVEAYNQEPNENPDGTRTIFTLPGPFVEGTTRVYLNGIRQYLSSAKSINCYVELVGSDQIDFGVAPLAGDVIIIDYRKNETP